MFKSEMMLRHSFTCKIVRNRAGMTVAPESVATRPKKTRLFARATRKRAECNAFFPKIIFFPIAITMTSELAQSSDVDTKPSLLDSERNLQTKPSNDLQAQVCSSLQADVKFEFQ